MPDTGRVKRELKEQKRTGRVKVRCPCGNPASGFSAGVPHCERCAKWDARLQEEREKVRTL